jgi:hypothetical protein
MMRHSCRRRGVRASVGADTPDVLDRVQLRGARGQEDQRHVLWQVQLWGRMPADAVEQQDGMGTLFNMAADLVEVKLHGLSVGKRQGQRCARAPRRADGAEQVRLALGQDGQMGAQRAGEVLISLDDRDVLRWMARPCTRAAAVYPERTAPSMVAGKPVAVQSPASTRLR